MGLWDIGSSLPQLPPEALASRSHMQPGPPGVPLKFQHHREFVTGIDYNLFVEGQVGSCAWDRQVCVWTLATPPP